MDKERIIERKVGKSYLVPFTYVDKDGQRKTKMAVCQQTEWYSVKEYVWHIMKIILIVLSALIVEGGIFCLVWFLSPVEARLFLSILAVIFSPIFVGSMYLGAFVGNNL